MPATAQAALVFLVAVVPGFLAMAGYRVGRVVPDHPDGLAATARVIAVSAFIAVVAWKFGGNDFYDHVRSGSALTTHETQTYRFAIELLLAPGVGGFFFGELVDAVTHRMWTTRSERMAASTAERREPLARRVGRMCLTILPARLLPDGPTTWDCAWRQICREDPHAFVRVTTKGGREIVGRVGDDSRIALSPQPRDLFIQQTFRMAADGTFRPIPFGLGTFVAGSEIEAVEWVAQRGEVTHV